MNKQSIATRRELDKCSAQLSILKSIIADDSKMTLQSKVEGQIDILQRSVKGLTKAVIKAACKEAGFDA